MTKEDIQRQIAQAIRDAKSRCPLTPSITNSVTINFVANAQLAVGGSAAMVYMPDEGTGLAKAGDAMYLNVGTLMPIYYETVPRTAKVLHETRTPWVLDPVAIGLGQLREDLLLHFKDCKPTIIRGNASEIIALASLWNLKNTTGPSKVRGVDSTDSVHSAQDAAIALAKWTGGAVAVSGKEDLVTDGTYMVCAKGGSPMMPCITGMGCSLGGVMTVYAAVTTPFIAALTGSNIYNFAGERAAAYSKGTGTFQANFIDELYTATPEDVAMQPFTLTSI